MQLEIRKFLFDIKAACELIGVLLDALIIVGTGINRGTGIAFKLVGQLTR